MCTSAFIMFTEVMHLSNVNVINAEVHIYIVITLSYDN